MGVAAGAGSTAGVDPITGQPRPNTAANCGVADPASIREELVDDAESGSGAISGTGRVGKWFASNDKSTQQIPADAANFSVGAGIEGPGAAGSMYAVHSTLTVPANSPWGGVIQVDFSSPRGAKDASDRKPYDASAFSGVKFLAKGSGSVQVQVLSANIVPSSQGGTCNDKCYDAHSTSLTLTSDWKEVRVPFASLAQSGVGAAAPFTANAIIGFAIKAAVGGAYDVWVDNLAFYSESKPDCAKYPGDARCPVTEAYCIGCAAEPRCKCVVNKCETGVITGPLACSAEAATVHTGGSTRYWISQASKDRDTSGGYEALACGFPVMSKGADGGSAATQDKILGAPGGGTLFAALNSTDFGANAALCGACVRVNDKVTVQIVDECPNRPGQQGNPACTAGHLDLSVAAANQVGGNNPQISWKIVPCDSPAPQYLWVKNSGPNWGGLVIAGLTYPARKVELKSGTGWVEAHRQDYWGPWIFNAVPPSPWTVKVTDMHGQVVVDTFESAGGAYANPTSGGVVQPYASLGATQLPICGQ
jgi:expansin (peptidoglycan-binding protein)